MKTIKHIIWDWNGTILDDAWVCVDIINAMHKKRNRPLITEKFYSDTFDFPVKDYYLKTGFDFNIDSFEDLSDEFMSSYERRKYECKIRSCFHELQPILKQNNIQQSVLSAYVDDYLKEILTHHKIIDNFTHVSGLANHFAESKIENGKILINKMNTPEDECVFIGDTKHDVDTADAMGIECWLIPSGHNSRKRLEKKTDKILNKLIDICEVFNLSS
jgi:phosphoglycolate phosphatase